MCGYFLSAQGVIKVINIEEPGTLEDLLPYDVLCDELVLKGVIDDSDINYLRFYIAGSQQCKVLNLKDVQIRNLSGVIDNKLSGNLHLSNIEDLILPDSLKVIGKKTIYSSRLTSIVIPENVDSILESGFEYCSNLREVVFNKKLKYIGEKAFRGTGLYEINLPDDIEEFRGAFPSKPYDIRLSEKNSFFTVKNKTIFTKDEKTLILYFGYDDTCSIPEGTLDIGDYAFANNTTVKYIKFPSSLERIGFCAFEESSNITSLVFSENLQEIKKRAFFFCENLTIFKFNESLKIIGEEAFNGCRNLYELYVPQGVTFIGDNAFRYATKSLAKIEVSPFNSEYCSLNNVLYTKDMDTLILSCNTSNYTIPEGVRVIGSYAFSDCSDLTSINYPKSLREIGKRAFHNCGFKKVVIPDYIERIGEYAFSENYDLTEFEIQSNMKTIETGVVFMCFALEKIVFSASVDSISEGNMSVRKTAGDNGEYDYVLSQIHVKSLLPPLLKKREWSSFDFINFCDLYVPQESVELYRNHPNWGKFVNIIGTDFATSINHPLGDMENIKIIRDGLVLSSVNSVNILIYNMRGQLVRSQKVNNSSVSISLPKGIYLVSIGDKVRKVIVPGL